jgi:hypothetical protein
MFKKCLIGPSSIKLFNRYHELLSQWVNPLGREADHSAPTAEAKNEWSDASVPSIHLHEVLLPHIAHSFMTQQHTANWRRLFTILIQVISNRHKSQPIPCQG